MGYSAVEGERREEPLRSILRALTGDESREKKSVRFQLVEDTARPARRTAERHQAEREARLERREQARVEAKQEMAAVALEMRHSEHQRISEAVKRALSEPHFCLWLRVERECEENLLVQYRPSDYVVAVRLLRALELLRRCGERSEQLARQHARLVEACLAPQMESSRHLFHKLCECEEVGEFVLPLSSGYGGDCVAALEQLSLAKESYTLRCNTYY